VSGDGWRTPVGMAFTSGGSGVTEQWSFTTNCCCERLIIASYESIAVQRIYLSSNFQTPRDDSVAEKCSPIASYKLSVAHALSITLMH